MFHETKKKVKTIEAEENQIKLTDDQVLELLHGNEVEVNVLGHPSQKLNGKFFFMDVPGAINRVSIFESEVENYNLAINVVSFLIAYLNDSRLALLMLSYQDSIPKLIQFLDEGIVADQTVAIMSNHGYWGKVDKQKQLRILFQRNEDPPLDILLEERLYNKGGFQALKREYITDRHKEFKNYVEELAKAKNHHKKNEKIEFIKKLENFKQKLNDQKHDLTNMINSLQEGSEFYDVIYPTTRKIEKIQERNRKLAEERGKTNASNIIEARLKAATLEYKVALSNDERIKLKKEITAKVNKENLDQEEINKEMELQRPVIRNEINGISEDRPNFKKICKAINNELNINVRSRSSMLQANAIHRTPILDIYDVYRDNDLELFNTILKNVEEHEKPILNIKPDTEDYSFPFTSSYSSTAQILATQGIAEKKEINANLPEAKKNTRDKTRSTPSNNEHNNKRRPNQAKKNKVH